MADKRRKASRASAGYVRKLPSGRYQASHVHEGQRYTAPHTFDAKVDADAWVRERLTDLARGAWSPELAEAAASAKAVRSQSLAEYAEGWLTTNRSRRGEPLRPRTVDEYRRLLGGPLAPLAALPLSKITAEAVDAWYDEQSRTGKLTQASRAYSLLSTILAHAVDRGRLAANPCRVRGAQSARTGRKVVPPTDAQLDAILEAIAPRFRALVYLAAEGGLRYGEATDLRRSDVTVERDESGAVSRVLVSVSHAVVKVGGQFVSGPTKTAAGVRAVYVYGAAAEAIAAHLDQYVSRFGKPLLFTAPGDETGTRHLSQSTFHTPWWSSAREAAGRPDMPFHALRHRAGTAYAQQGATIAETMARLGHSSAAVAMRYQHATDRDADLAARMAKRPAR